MIPTGLNISGLNILGLNVSVLNSMNMKIKLNEYED